MKSFLTIMGMYQYDSTIFDLFALPDKIKDKRQDIINSICLETQELEVLYPSTLILQMAIGNWSNVMLSVWEKMYNTTTFEYNPIENYDRTDETIENENVKENIKRNDTLKNTTDNTGNSELINQNVAYNDTNFTNNEKTMNNINNKIVETGTNKYDTGRNLTNGKTTKNRSHGNIGVTTSQQMIEQERQISEFNIVKYIVDDFKQKFCLMIY